MVLSWSKVGAMSGLENYKKGGVSMEFEFIEDGDMEFAKRGRQPVVNVALRDALAQFAKAPKGKRLALKGLALDVKADDYKVAKARVSAVIRSHAKMVGLTVTVAWSLTGVPTVVRKTK